MIVRQFLQWVRTAEAAERAEATSALARAYLYSDPSYQPWPEARQAEVILSVVVHVSGLSRIR